MGLEKTTTQTVSGGNGTGVNTNGRFEDADGVEWNDGGTVKLLKHCWFDVTDLATGTLALENAVIATYADQAAEIVTYNTSFVRGAIEADSNGEVECYVEYSRAAVSQTLNTYVALYPYIPQKIPEASTGAQVGSSGSPCASQTPALWKICVAEWVSSVAWIPVMRSRLR